VKRHHDRGLVTIGAFKLIESVFFLLVGVGVIHFIHRDLGDEATRLAERLRFDLDGRLMTWVMDHLDSITAHRMKQISALTFFYAGLRIADDALKSAPEGEFVTVQNTGDDVRVAKEHGQVVVHVIDKNSKETVDVTVPWDVVEALVSNTADDQLNVEAAIRALQNVGDTTLVRVSGSDENVRVWIDSRNTHSE
jgi:hypothetical protein